jgi:hypothetical protein
MTDPRVGSKVPAGSRRVPVNLEPLNSLQVHELVRFISRGSKDFTRAHLFATEDGPGAGGDAHV